MGPRCSVPIETVVETSTTASRPPLDAEIPKGATLDTMSAECHKSTHRFRCQCSTGASTHLQ